MTAHLVSQRATADAVAEPIAMHSLFLVTAHDLEAMGSWPGSRLHQGDVVMYRGTCISSRGQTRYAYQLLVDHGGFVRLVNFSFELSQPLRTLHPQQLDSAQLSQLLSEGDTDAEDFSEAHTRITRELAGTYKPELGWVLVRGLPTATFRLTKAETELLMRASAKHYDSTCREASLEGGFIYKWHADVHYDGQFATDDPYLQGTSRDFDLVCKVLEYSVVGFNKAELEAQKVLRIKCGQILHRMSDAYGVAWQLQFPEYRQSER